MTQEKREPPRGFEDAPCPLCGGDRYRVVVRAHDRLSPGGPERYAVVRCLDCGTAYLRPRPTADAVHRFYPDSYWRSANGGLAETLAAAYGRRLQREVVEWLAARRPGRGRVVDVGCGSGDLLVALRADGWQVLGVEPGEAAAREARGSRGLDVIGRRFEDARLSRGAFDAVVFAGVLEHLHEPLRALREAADVVAEDGVVAVLFLPMIDSPEARLFGPRWLALDLPRHLTHFSDASFRAMAAAAGLEVVGREPYSRRHNAAQLAASIAPGLQKQRFSLAESGDERRGLRRQVWPVARRAVWLAAVTSLRPAARLAAAAGATPVCSYFLERRS